MKLYLTFYSLVIFSSILFAQSTIDETTKLNFGFMFESTILKINDIDPFLNESDNSRKIFPVSIFFSGKYNLNKNFTFELRPGYLFGDRYYQGFEVGVFIRYLFNKSKFSIITGVNFHKNKSVEDDFSFTSINDGIFSFYNISGSYFLRPNFAFIVSYYYPMDSNKLYTYNPPTMQSFIREPRFGTIKDIIKIGIDFTF